MDLYFSKILQSSVSGPNVQFLEINTNRKRMKRERADDDGGVKRERAKISLFDKINSIRHALPLQRIYSLILVYPFIYVLAVLSNIENRSVCECHVT